MKYLVLLVGIVSQGAMAMSGFPGGSYLGSGSWKNQAGETGRYQVATQVEADSVCSQYSWNGGSRDFCLKVEFSDTGFFTTERGQGYCYDYQCHYRIDFDAQNYIEETLTFVDGKLYKLGSKDGIAWQEALDHTN